MKKQQETGVWWLEWVSGRRSEKPLKTACFQGFLSGLFSAHYPVGSSLVLCCRDKQLFAVFSHEHSYNLVLRCPGPHQAARLTRNATHGCRLALDAGSKLHPVYCLIPVQLACSTCEVTIRASWFSPMSRPVSMHMYCRELPCTASVKWVPKSILKSLLLILYIAGVQWIRPFT